MSLKAARTTKTIAHRMSALTLAGLVSTALGGCDAPPDGADEVEPISGALTAVMQNAVVADSPTGPVQMVFSISRPFDPTNTPLDITFNTLDFGANPATAGAACANGADYIAVAGRALTFPAGVSTITTAVTVCPDAIVEGAQTFATHVVDAATKRCDGERCAAIGTIIDPPGPPVLPALRISNVKVNECRKGPCLAVFTLSLSAPTSADVIVQATTASDTAGSNLYGCAFGYLHPDFAAVDRQVSIPAGATSATLSVPICSDFVAEPTERFFVNLSNPTNATIADARGIGTIED